MNKRMKALGLVDLLRPGRGRCPSWPRKAAACPSDAKASLYKLSIIVGGAIITLAAAAGAFCQAKAISSACEGISRNPAPPRTSGSCCSSG